MQRYAELPMRPDRIMTAGCAGVICVAAFLCWITVAGCSQHSERLGSELPDGADLPILAERHDISSSYARPLRAVIHDRGTLAGLGLVDLPVDFTQQMVLLAAMGPAANEECRIRILHVWRDGSRLRVEVESTYPPDTSLHRPGMTSPFHAVVVPRSDLPIDRFSGHIPPNALSRKAIRKP
jgi:hypothetical protein